MFIAFLIDLIQTTWKFLHEFPLQKIAKYSHLRCVTLMNGVRLHNLTVTGDAK